MKNSWIVLVFSSILLSACGGSEGGSSNSSSSHFPLKLSNTSWEKECSAYNKFLSNELTDAWNVKIRLSIDSSLNATYRTEYFHPSDTKCNSMMFDALDISRFDIRGKVISDESIEAFGLNETFTFNSGNRTIPPNFTLIYVDSEKLYFGQATAKNSGDTPETRHSSISLNHYFRKVLN